MTTVTIVSLCKEDIKLIVSSDEGTKKKPFAKIPLLTGDAIQQLEVLSPLEFTIASSGSYLNVEPCGVKRDILAVIGDRNGECVFLQVSVNGKKME